MAKDGATPEHTIGRRQLVLLTLALQPDGTLGNGLRGITRLQKFLFLLQQEYGVSFTGENALAFKPYKAGPYSKKIYDDLELLENLGLIESESTGDATEAEHNALEDLTFGHLLGSDAEALSSESAELAETSDSFDERRFKLTPEGKAKVEELLRSEAAAPFCDRIRKVKSRFANHSLKDLLHYVYTKYDAWTGESEIRDQVLSRGRRQS
ncbi:MAG: hypothetical protein JJU33_06725 [Phycisphaerales bacterium]|nr:hypothetical protein [Phycisphaerales bacterium]